MGTARRSPALKEAEDKNARIGRRGAAARHTIERLAAEKAAPPSSAESFSSIDDLIKKRTPEAIDELNQGADKARFMAALAGNISDDLKSFQRPEATREQNALLGLLGAEAQEQAIGGIPVSSFDQELQRRQSAQQQRQAFSTGDVSGASLLGQQQLGAQQQFGNIQQRLSELEPFAATNRGITSTQAGLREAAGINQANIQYGQGVGQGNIRLGAAAPIVDSIMNRAEASGLQGIASAQNKANTQNQLARLAGTVAPVIGSYFSQPQAIGSNIIPQQAGYSNANYSPAPNALTGSNVNYSPAPQFQF